METELKNNLSQSKELGKEMKETKIEKQDLGEFPNDKRNIDDFDLVTLKSRLGDENLEFSLDTNGNLCDQNGNCVIPKDQNMNGYGRLYDVKTELRKKFKNSYFECDIYDDSIVGVNLLTGSIIYELQGLGSCFCEHVENNRADLGDRLEMGGDISHGMFDLTPEELQGKVRPTIILLSQDLKYWNDVRYFTNLPPEIERDLPF